jgi:hypothetical protein
MKNKHLWYLPAIVTALGLAAALIFTRLFPAVEGLGSKVRLPVFHGSLTWANLVLFGLLALVSTVAFFTQKPQAYAWDRAFRYTAIGFWLAGTVLGLLAAFISWDFTGAQTAPWKLLLQDPRLKLQFIVALFGLVVLLLPLFFDSLRARAGVDALYSIATLAGLAIAMTAGAGLHPDSPVMSSDEVLIKVIFLCMFAGQLVAVLGLTALVKSLSKHSVS